MGCKKKLTDTCGKKVNARCVDYEGNLHKNTKIEECDNPSIEDVVEDINLQVDKLSDSLDLSELGDKCITYTKEGEELQAKEAFLALEEKVCGIADFVGLPRPGCTGCQECSPIFDLDISCVNLDLGGLVDACGEQPATLKDLLQLMLNKINE